MGKIILPILLPMILAACYFNAELPQNMPSPMKTGINPVATSDSVRFTFEDRVRPEKAYLPTADYYGTVYNVDEALRNRFKDWARTKFNLTKSDSSSNYVNLKVIDIYVDYSDKNPFITMIVWLSLTGRINGKELNYKASKGTYFPPEQKKPSISALLDNLILKVDKYVDKSIRK